LAIKNAGEAPLKAWAGALPSWANSPVGSVTDPGDTVECGCTDLPGGGVQFQTDGTAEFVDGEVDGTEWSPSGAVACAV